MDIDFPPPSLFVAEKSAAMRFFELEMGPHDALFSRLPTRSLVRLMGTCRRVYSLVKDTCFSLPRLLSPFFGDATKVLEFRSMQSLTGTLISGSVALQFFNRMTWPSSDLDIYVHRTFADLAVMFIVRNGYTFDPRKSQNKEIFKQLSSSTKDRPLSYLGRGIADVLDFYKGDKKIQVIVATNTPMEIILSFHSTCVMNVITHDNAFALYPWSTFVTHQALIVGTVGAGQEAGREAGRQKYIDRGWTMVRAPSLSSESELGVRMVRWVGDSFTWTISLPTFLPTKALDLCRINSWQLYFNGKTTRTTWELLNNPALEYSYTMGDSGTLSAVSDDVFALTAFRYGLNSPTLVGVAVTSVTYA
ncbi:hypothetical protein B0H13DRAFT_2671757 [Mycena leptocephala]|nr:hypothetical protein B0H13DRAFT_2671757 [Mycena leptocephala]